MARTGREFAVAQSPQFTAQGLHRDPDVERLPDPLHQIHQAPTDNAMDRRDRAALNHLSQRSALGRVQLGRSTRALGIDQTLWTAPVEAQHPITNRLQANAANPGRIAA